MTAIMGFFGTIFATGVVMFLFDQFKMSPRIRGWANRMFKEKIRLGTVSDEYEQRIEDAQNDLERARKEVHKVEWEQSKIKEKIKKVKKKLKEDGVDKKHYEKMLTTLESAHCRISEVCENANEDLDKQKEMIEKASSRKEELKARQQLVELQKSINNTISGFKVGDSILDDGIFEELENEVEREEFMLEKERQM